MHKIPFKIKVLSKVVYVEEPSFSSFKSFTKNLLNVDDVEEVFEEYIESIIRNNVSLNVYEKFLLLLHVRGLIFGNDIQFENDGKKITISITDIIEYFEKPYEKIFYTYNDTQYVFDYKKNFKSAQNKISFLLESLYEIDGEKITTENIIDYLPALNFNEIFDIIIKQLYTSREYQIPTLDITINPINCIAFLKNIFNCDLMELYELEYTLRKYLNFNTDDLSSTALPECKILLNYYIKDMKQQETKMNKLKSSNQ